MTRNSDRSDSKSMLILACILSLALGAGTTYFLIAKKEVRVRAVCPEGCVWTDAFGSPGCYDLAAALNGELKPCG